MTPTSAKKNGARYRYYASCALFQGRKDEAGSVARVPAPEVEALVLKTLRQVADASDTVTSMADAATLDDRGLIKGCLDRVIVRKGALEVLWQCEHEAQARSVITKWCLPSMPRRRDIVMPDGSSADEARPIRSETRARVVEGIAKARLWMDDLVSGRVTNTAELASRERCSERSVRMILGLAFLSPSITKAAVDGSLPRGIGITELVTAPANWRAQLCPR
jgi:hypothetical protein